MKYPVARAIIVSSLFLILVARSHADSTLRVNVASGAMNIAVDSSGWNDVEAFEITSSAGSLLPATNTVPDVLTSGMVLGDSSHFYAEGVLGLASSFTSGQVLALEVLFSNTKPQDLVFSLSIPAETVSGP